jgi:hypothetical protein
MNFWQALRHESSRSGAEELPRKPSEPVLHLEVCVVSVDDLRAALRCASGETNHPPQQIREVERLAKADVHSKLLQPVGHR